VPVTTTTTVRAHPPSPPSRPPGRAASNGSAPDRGGAEAPVGLLGAAGTALAAGIATAVSRRRHARRRRLPRGAEEPAPPTALDGLRREVLLGADADRAALVQRALRDLAKSLAENGSEVRPRLVQVGRHGIEVLLSQPAVPAPPGWRAEASGNTWVLAGDPPPDDDGPAALPALVTIGRPEAGTELHLDLEAEGVVALHGDVEAAAALARSMVLELSTSPAAAGVSVLVLGERLHPPTGADRVRSVNTWSEVAAKSERRLEQSADLVAANRWPTPVAGRARSTHSDDLAPLVVVAEDAGDDAFARFCASVLDSRAAVAVVVVGGGPEGATVLDVEPEVLSIASLGLCCVPQSVSSEAADAVQELLDDAEHIPDQLSFLPAPAAPLHTVGDAYADPPHDVLVQLLGEIAVIGGSRRLTPQETAVVAFVALNGPVAADRIEDAVWSGGTSSRRKRLSNTLSECRAVLGSAALPLARDGRYRTGSALACDVDLFERRLAYAAGQPEAAAVVTLRGALEKVKGPVFSYRHADRASFAWVDIDNWLSRWELKVTNAAEDLAERLLALGDHDEVGVGCRARPSRGQDRRTHGEALGSGAPRQRRRGCGSAGDREPPGRAGESRARRCRRRLDRRLPRDPTSRYGSRISAPDASRSAGRSHDRSDPIRRVTARPGGSERSGPSRAAAPCSTFGFWDPLHAACRGTRQGQQAHFVKSDGVWPPPSWRAAPLPARRRARRGPSRQGAPCAWRAPGSRPLGRTCTADPESRRET
jgi:hypothetical protein